MGKEPRAKSSPLSPVYFLFGPESYLIEEEIQRLLDQALTPKARGLNLHLFNGGEAPTQEILQTVRTLPMFSPYRLVVLRRADELDAGEVEALIPYIQNPSPSTCLVMTGQALGPWRKYQKEVERHGKVIEYPRLKGTGLVFWVRKRMVEKGKVLSEEAARYLVERVGDHLQDLDQALEKVFLSVREKEKVELSDVEEIGSDVRVSTIYELTEAIGEQDLQKALTILEKAIEQKGLPFRKEEPLQKRMDDPLPFLLDMMARHYWNLWRVKEMAGKQKDIEEIAETLSMKPWAVRKLLAQGSKFSIASLREGIDRCHQTDLAIKIGRGDRTLLLEKLVIDLCLPDRKGSLRKTPVSEGIL